MLAPALVAEYSGAPGVTRSPLALVMARTWPDPASTIGGRNTRNAR